MFELKPEMLTVEQRIEMGQRCRDADSIPKVADAGLVRYLPSGHRVQIMHNGLKVVADGYYGEWMTRLIQLCQGHHEAQEERMFHEVVSRLPPSGVMIELGGYWAFYSLWYLHGAPGRRAIVVEPDPAHLDIGRRNAALNSLAPEFIQGFVGGEDSMPMPFQTEESGIINISRYSVSRLMARRGLDYLDILHCDTQGAETTVLASCEPLFREGRVGWVFVSTHAHQISGDPLTHQRCLDILRSCGAVIEAEHDVHESFSGDGLIVARFAPAPPGWRTVPISHNRHGTSLFRELNYDLADRMKASTPPQPAATPPAQSEGLALPLPAGPLSAGGLVLSLERDGRLGRKGDRLMSPIDKVMLPAILHDGAWQQEEIDFVTNRVEAGAGYTLVDIGANIGLFTRQMLEALPDLGRCLCVEPDPANFEALEFNLRRYDPARLELFNHALGDRDGSLTFFRDRENMGNYSLNFDAMRNRPFDEGSVRVVETARWMEKHLHNGKKILWKSDTQGFDEAIICAVPDAIWDRIQLAVIELWRIQKPDFDRAAFRRRIASFPSRTIGKTAASVEDILDYLSGSDWQHDDLYLWR